MKKIKFLLGLTFILAVNITSAQQIKNYNLYSQNPVLYNPSTVLNDDFLRVYLNSHLQWINYPGAPLNNVLGIGVAFFPNMGAGVSVMNNRVGLYNNLRANLKYAYRINFSDQHSLNMGLSMGISNNRLMAENAENININDVSLMDDYLATTNVISGFGLAYKLKNFEAQFIMPQLYEEKKLNLYSIGMIGYNFELNSSVDLKPSVVVRAPETSPVQFDGNLMATWKKKVWTQLSYRSKSSLIFSVGLNFNNYAVGYAYQADIQPVNINSSGTHEVQLIYRIGNDEEIFKNQKTNFYGKVLNEYDDNPVYAKIIVYENDVKIAEIETIKDNGYYSLELKPDRTYNFEVKSDGYEDAYEMITIDKDQAEKEQIIKLKPEKTFVTGKIQNKYSKNGLAGNIYVLDGNKIVAETTANDNGDFQVYLDPQKNYTFRVTSESYEKEEKAVSINDEEKISETIELNPLMNLSGTIVDKETGEPISANVEIFDNVNNKTLKIVKTDTITGEFSYDFKDLEDISITIISADYALYTENVNVDFSSTSIVKNFKLETLPLEEKVSLTNVFFDLESAELRPKGKEDIDKLIIVMKQNPEIIVEISGYTDITGPKRYNKVLSKQRAQAVVDYMVENGIKANRLKVVGYGINNPQAPNDTEENMQKNRRVEAKLIYKPE